MIEKSIKIPEGVEINLDRGIVLVKGPNKDRLDTLALSFLESIAPNRLYIDLNAITENINTIRSILSPKVKVMAIVKALAYGTDTIYISRHLAETGIDYFGVSFPDEGAALRKAFINKPILVFCFHLMHHIKREHRDVIYQFVKQTGSKCILVEPNPYNPLIFLQILFHRNMSVTKEIKYILLTRRKYRRELEENGLTLASFKRFCFFPPFILTFFTNIVKWHRCS